MAGQTLVVMQDPVADALDDMAALGLHWTRNRERGRMPSGIRQAMLLVAREALAHADMADRAMASKFDDLCGPAAYEKLHSAVDFKTAKQAGLVAGDGRPCPNDHDPDCRWPECHCRQPNAA